MNCLAENNKIRIETFSLFEACANEPLRTAFSELESVHFQYGCDWLTNLAEHSLHTGESTAILTATDCSGNVAALAVKIDSGKRQAHALGNFYTSAFSPLLSDDNSDQLLAALFEHLARTKAVAEIILSPMNTADPAFSLLPSAMRNGGWKGVHTFPCFGNWVYQLKNQSWNEYIDSRPSRVRNTLRRKSRKFFDSDRGDLELIQSGEDLQRGICEFNSVYAKSWKKAEPFPDFIPGLLRLSAARGWLRLGIAHYDNEPIAAQIWLVNKGTAYIFKLAYDADHANLSPGTVLTAFMMKNAIETDRVVRIDYMSGDDPYKQDWMSERNEFQGVSGYNARTSRGVLRLTAHKLKKIFKQLV